jgi:hypothetical protein
MPRNRYREVWCDRHLEAALGLACAVSAGLAPLDEPAAPAFGLAVALDSAGWLDQDAACAPMIR